MQVVFKRNTPSKYAFNCFLAVRVTVYMKTKKVNIINSFNFWHFLYKIHDVTDKRTH